MRVPIPIEIALVITREVVRALVVPLHVLAFLPWRRRHVARSAQALAAALGAERRDARADFVAAHAPTAEPSGTIFLSCGEASAETHAVHLIDALERECVQVGREPPRWIGFGGQRLARRGVDIRYPLADHAVMGLSGVLAALPMIVRVFARYLRALRDDRPALIVLVDFPGLHLVMAEAAKRHGVPVLHYVAPQYWGWGPWRMKRYRRAVDGTLTILPFEPAFFDDRKLASAYVGHPLLDEIAAHPPDPAIIAEIRQRPTLVLMPGSRRREIALHLAPMLRAAGRLLAAHPDARVVIPHRDADRAAAIRDELEHLGAADRIEVHTGDPAPWLRGARAVLCKSGTGSLESCLHGAPTVVVYVVHGWLERFVLNWMLTVPFFAGANLCAGRRIVPELAIEADAQWPEADAELARLWADGPVREQCLQDLAELRGLLGEPGASQRAARWITPFCRADAVEVER